jgi:hypothetical protein
MAIRSPAALRISPAAIWDLPPRTQTNGLLGRHTAVWWMALGVLMVAAAHLRHDRDDSRNGSFTVLARSCLGSRVGQSA